MRHIDENGFSKNKAREWNPTFATKDGSRFVSDKSALEDIRAHWSDFVNHSLEKNGFDEQALFCEEVYKIMDDLVEHGCDVVTIGQYLQPTKMHLAVAEYVHPDVFAELKEIGLKKGFKYVESGPLVRSSYHAERHVG